jgi:hypothetical protein
LQVVLRAQETPAYRSAMLTLLLIARKYTTKLAQLSASLASAPSSLASADAPPVELKPILWTDPHLSRALADLQALVERAASGYPLDPLLGLLQRTAADVLAAPAESEVETRRWFADAAGWLDAALRRAGYAGSAEGTRAAEALYDRARALFAARDAQGQPATRVGRDAQAILQQADALLGALASDGATRRLLGAADALAGDAARFSTRAAAVGSREAARAAVRWRAEITRDVVGWLVPRVLRALRAVPMPRVEYVSGALDVALDALLVTAPTTRDRTLGTGASLLPDHVVVSNWSELRLDVVREDDQGAVVATPLGGGAGRGTTGAGGVSTVGRVRVSVDGLRVAAHDVGYYVCYKGPWGLGYEDEGLASLDVGRADRAGEGVRLELELEFDTAAGTGAESSWLGSWGATTAAEHADAPPLFRVIDVKADVPGLRFALDRSKHWILNKTLLQPLVAPVGRAVVRLLVARQVKAALEGLATTLGAAKRDVDRRADERGTDAEWTDWWEAVGQRFQGPARVDDEEQEPDEEGDEDAPEVETHTTPTAKGIVRTTVVQPPPPTDGLTSPPPAETSALAVGVGAQLLPGKGGAHDAHGHAGDYAGDAPATIAREALDEVQERVEAAEHAVEEAVDGAVRVREEIEGAEVRGTVRRRVEAKRGGWKSRAFDLW